MTDFGYAISSEEHGPAAIVDNARRAEGAGFGYALISDHFHPWTSTQGESPFVWTAIGAILARTERLVVGTGVTCPLIRTHPAIVAHAAATCAALAPGRFFLGLGTGENLNEHVLGDRWPAPDERVEMLEEAIEVIRLLWQGGMQTHRGKHYTVDHAQLFTLPPEPPPIAVAAAKQKSAERAAQLGDALVSTSPDEQVVAAYRDAGGDGPRYGKVTVCWAASEEEAVRTALEVWPNSGLPGDLGQELATPDHFEQAAQLVTEEKIAEALVCGPDPARYVERVREFEGAGFSHIYFHQVGRDQEGFFRFWEDELRGLL